MEHAAINRKHKVESQTGGGRKSCDNITLCDITLCDITAEKYDFTCFFMQTLKF